MLDSAPRSYQLCFLKCVCECVYILTKKKIIVISTQCFLLCRLNSYSVNSPKWRSQYQGTPLTPWRESHICRWKPRVRNRILTFPPTEGLSCEDRYGVQCGSVRTCRGRQQKFHSWVNFRESERRWWNGEISNMRRNVNQSRYRPGVAQRLPGS